MRGGVDLSSLPPISEARCPKGSLSSPERRLRLVSPPLPALRRLDGWRWLGGLFKGSGGKERSGAAVAVAVAVAQAWRKVAAKGAAAGKGRTAVPVCYCNFMGLYI